MNNFGEPIVSVHELDKILVNARQFLSPMALQMLSKADIRTYMEERIRRLVIDIQSYVIAMPTQRIEIHRQWPADWWQAVRERWFPRWWLKRWPVRYERIEVNQQIYGPICPHVHAPEPDQHFRFLVRSVDLPIGPTP